MLSFHYSTVVERFLFYPTAVIRPGFRSNQVPGRSLQTLSVSFFRSYRNTSRQNKVDLCGENRVELNASDARLISRFTAFLSFSAAKNTRSFAGIAIKTLLPC